MGNFNEIYEMIKPIFYELAVYKHDLFWVGNQHQTNIVKDASYLITGLLPGNCGPCLGDTIMRVVRWKDNYEQTLIEQEKTLNQEIKSVEIKLGLDGDTNSNN